MRLDTLPSMVEAIALYKNFGFAPIASYYETPLSGTIFLARKLRSLVSDTAELASPKDDVGVSAEEPETSRATGSADQGRWR